MGSARDKLEELNLSRDEVERIGEALKNEFRQLLNDYVEEIQDPENKKLYEQDIIQLEKERGVDVTFINPKPGYVIKTSVNGTTKGFINICVNENVQKPSSVPAMEGGSRGLKWSIPHTLSPPREDIDNKGGRCQVFDVVFHPDTLHLARNNKAFAVMVNNTACDAVEANFDVKLDKKNLKFPNLKYKGMAHATIIRKPSVEKPVERTGEEKEFYDQLYKQVDEMSAKDKKYCKKAKKPKQNNVDDKSNYTIPKHIIKHRNHVDIQDFTDHKGAKLNAAIPKELVIEVNLPLLKASTDITLDVTEKTVQLLSENPAKYKLFLTLPYSVNQDSGNAKFDKDSKKLLVTLPVKQKTIMVSEFCDSGIESDHCLPLSPESDSSLSETSPVQEMSAQTNSTKTSESVVQNSPHYRTTFLDENLHYLLPDYNCHVFENIIAFTLNVRNVDQNSICKLIDGASLHLKFASISPSFYTVHYAFNVRLPQYSIQEDNVSVEAWDNNVVLQISFDRSLEDLKSYYAGICEPNLKLRYIQEPFIVNSVLEKASLEAIIKEEILESTRNTSVYPLELKEMAPIEEVEELPKEPKDEILVPDDVKAEEKPKTEAIDILSLSCESSSDEMSYSYSPSKSKGILKKLARKPLGRSISESSLDEFICSSVENCHTSVDSVIPEDGEISSSFKKTVRFNDVVSRQLYRSNSSILGQKKKNQRKAKNKKKSQTRRVSESDASEVEEKNEGDLETLLVPHEEGTMEVDLRETTVNEDLNMDNDIFQIDIDV